MIAIIDYGVGNLFSLRSSLNKIGADTVVTADPAVIAKADKLILPGVGAFADAAKKLRDSGLDTVIKTEAAAGKPSMIILDTVKGHGCPLAESMFPCHHIAFKAEDFAPSLQHAEEVLAALKQ